MLYRFFTFLLLSGMSFGLMGIGCCDGCNDLVEPSPSFCFSPDSTSGVGFRAAEIRTAYVVRYTDAELTTPLDTLRQYSAAAVPSGREYLQVCFPDRGCGAGYCFYPPLRNYAGREVNSLRVVVPATGRQYEVSHISWEAQYSRGRCSCGTITKLDLVLDGQPVNARGHRVELRR